MRRAPHARPSVRASRGHGERQSAYAGLDGGGKGGLGPALVESDFPVGPAEGIESVVVIADHVEVDVAELDGDVRLADLRIHEPGHVFYPEDLRIRIQMDVLAGTRNGRQYGQGPQRHTPLRRRHDIPTGRRRLAGMSVLVGQIG